MFCTKLNQHLVMIWPSRFQSKRWQSTDVNNKLLLTRGHCCKFITAEWSIWRDEVIINFETAKRKSRSSWTTPVPLMHACVSNLVSGFKLRLMIYDHHFWIRLISSLPAMSFTDGKTCFHSTSSSCASIWCQRPVKRLSLFCKLQSSFPRLGKNLMT